MKTENEIIKETVEFYWADPKRRAVTDLGCEYLTLDGRMCAVGRCLTPQHAKRAQGLMCGVDQLPDLLKATLDEMLQPEYRGHSVDFWTHLQALHDGPQVWNTEGLLRPRLAYYFPNFPFDSLNLPIRND
jgi:hypothetical protein